MSIQDGMQAEENNVSILLVGHTILQEADQKHVSSSANFTGVVSLFVRFEPARGGASKQTAPLTAPPRQP